MKCQYRIVVSIDGGGIRGIVPLKILSSIQSLAHELDPTLDIASFVDVFSGSSTGSIIGGTLMIQDSKGKSIHTPKSLLNFYMERGEQIFNRRPQADVQSTSHPLSFVLDRFFGNITVEEIRKHFLFVSYDMNSDSQFLFTDAIERYRNITLAKIMQGCSAFPGIFPPLQLGNLQLVDGIIAAKNPSVLAYNYAKKLYPDDPIVLISLGTGKTVEEVPDAFEREMMIVDEDLYLDSKKDRNLIYFRFQPTIRNASNDLNDNSRENVMNLIRDTEHYIGEHTSKFDRLLSLVRIKSGIPL